MNAITQIRAAVANAVDPNDDDLPPLTAPKVTDAMYYGLVGNVMRAASDGTEIHPAAAGIAFATFAAVALGRNRFVQIGDTRHHARLYTVHVGRSSVAGKGMALALTRRVRRECEWGTDPLQDAITGNFHDGGLSSREGLAWLIRDESDTKDKDGEPTDSGVKDKRLFIVEEELANVLKQSARDGNTLSSAIRAAWDGHDIAPATKTNRTRASKPHIGIHACITPGELGTALDTREITNGFANRFLFCWAERRGIIPYPPPTPTTTVEAIARKLSAAIGRASSDGGMSVSAGARDRFSAFYADHRRGFGTSMLVRGLLERHPPYAWRLALLFALLEQVDEIAEPHMDAALAWLAYCRESTMLVFSTAAQEAEAGKTAELGQRIVDAITRKGGAMDREPLRLALGKPDKREMDAALDQRIEAGEIEEATIPKEGGGRALRRYVLKDGQRFERFARFGPAPTIEQTAEAQRFATVCPSGQHDDEQTVQTAGAARFAETRTRQQTAQTIQTAATVSPDDARGQSARMPRVTCAACQHYQPDAINPAQGMGRCGINADHGGANWPHERRACRSFRPKEDRT